MKKEWEERKGKEEGIRGGYSMKREKGMENRNLYLYKLYIQGD
jgi:hypothetical protein